jgi:hypothetical protein
MKKALADEPGSHDVITAFDSLTAVQESFADEKRYVDVSESKGGEIVVNITDRGI